MNDSILLDFVCKPVVQEARGQKIFDLHSSSHYPKMNNKFLSLGFVMDMRYANYLLF